MHRFHPESADRVQAIIYFSSGKGDPMRILIAEDDAQVRRTIESLLSDRGHEVTAVEDGRTALRALQENGLPGLVLCDIGLAGMSGIDFLKIARERFPETPVILMTGDREVDTAIRAFRAGARDYLKKPINVQELLECIAGIEKSHSRTTEIGGQSR